MTAVVYMAHPVAPTSEQIESYWWLGDLTDPMLRATAERAAVDGNLSSARRWLRWLVAHTDWAIDAPWMPYVEALGETPQHRERGLRDDCAMAARCDAIVLVGGRVSSGMARERGAVAAASGLVLDLTDLGALPPAGEWRDALHARARAAIEALGWSLLPLGQASLLIGVGKRGG